MKIVVSLLAWILLVGLLDLLATRMLPPSLRPLPIVHASQEIVQKFGASQQPAPTLPPQPVTAARNDQAERDALQQQAIDFNRCMNDDWRAWRLAQSSSPGQGVSSRKMIDLATACRARVARPETDSAASKTITIISPDGVKTVAAPPPSHAVMSGGMEVPDGDSQGAMFTRRIMAIHECMDARLNAWFATEKQWTVDQQRAKTAELSDACQGEIDHPALEKQGIPQS
jgi:hypothetical protein